MFTINKIKIKNVKGKSNWDHTFDGLCSNKVNLFVAPNGEGKSSIAVAFKASAHGNIKLEKSDYYQGDENNEPSLRIEYTTDGNTCEVVSDNTHGEISRTFSVFSISNPLYAKATGRSIGNYATHTAALCIQDLEVCEIPANDSIPYKFIDYKRQFGTGTPNLNNFLSSEDGIEFILDNKNLFEKCLSQIRLRNVLNNLNSNNIQVEELIKHDTLKRVLQDLKSKFSIAEEDAARYLIQLVSLLRQVGFDVVKNALAWKNYNKLKKILNQRIDDFNTTGLDLRTRQSHNKLSISFGRANRMSNGERDVLFFVTSLMAVESRLGRKPGILVIDEVFDYLDGANLLAVQYYLSQMIKKVKDEGKVVIPIIMTHLDPAVFANYCFKGMAVHYLTNKSKIGLDDSMAYLLLVRSQLRKNNDSMLNDFESHLLHYHPDNWIIPQDILNLLPKNFFIDSFNLREYLYQEVTEKYLTDADYNALAVIIALRIKVEEKTVAMIPCEHQQEYYEKHGSKEKLHYAEECGCELPEIFYLLQPLYNDSAHLRVGSGSEKENKNKIESAYLKLYSPVIKMMIKEVFQ